MENLYDDYADVLGMVRQEYRLAPLLDLVTLAIDYGYDTTLADIYYQPLPDQNEECLRLEAIINRCAIALAQRLGIGLHPQQALNKPKEVVRILHGLLETFDEFEDKDSLYGILCSGEPPQYILENLCRHVYGDNELHFEDLITVVEPRCLTVMRNFLAASASEEAEEGLANPRMARIVPYLRIFPENPSSFVFLNLPDVIDENAVIQSLDFSEDNAVSDIQLLTIYTVGLAIIAADTFEEAYELLEDKLVLLNNDELPEGPILKDALAALREIYGTQEDEDDEG